MDRKILLQDIVEMVGKTKYYPRNQIWDNVLNTVYCNVRDNSKKQVFDKVDVEMYKRNTIGTLNEIWENVQEYIHKRKRKA
jgi:hypothetical protein